MPVSKYVFTAIEPVTAIERSFPEEQEYRLPDAYHKILDYRVVEILLGVFALATIAFLRVHFHH